MTICANQTTATMCRPCVCSEQVAAEEGTETREVGRRANDNGGRADE